MSRHTTAEQTIAMQCLSCGEWALVCIGAYCPMCGNRVLIPGDAVMVPCDDCGKRVLWPANDDRSRGVLCPPCIHRLVSTL